MASEDAPKMRTMIELQWACLQIGSMSGAAGAPDFLTDHDYFDEEDQFLGTLEEPLWEVQGVKKQFAAGSRSREASREASPHSQRQLDPRAAVSPRPGFFALDGETGLSLTSPATARARQLPQLERTTGSDDAIALTSRRI